MKKIYKLMIILLVAFITFGSCSEDWLEVELVGTELFGNELIDTDEEAFAVLCGAYDMLQNQYVWGWASSYLIANLASDDARVVGGGTGDQPGYWDIDRFETNSENGMLNSIWRSNYYGIYRANIVINELSLESANLSLYQAEAKFLRAYYYFDLVRYFGEVVFYTENLAPSEYASQQNTPIETIYGQIEQDLLEAIPVLPLKSAQSNINKTRVTKGAAQALLGKVYLYQEKFTESANIFEEVIASGEYELTPEYDSIWKKTEEYGIESVFEVPYGIHIHGDPWSYGRQGEGNVIVQLTGPRDVGIDGLINSGWGFDMVDQSLVNAFDAQGDDVRRDATTFNESLFEDINGTPFPETSQNQDYTGWFQKKRTTWTAYFNNSQGYDGFWSWETNERIIRFADVLLMAAEAHNRKPSPNDTQALNYVNLVRARAGLGDISSTGSALLDDIKLERRLELSFEGGHRYFDLIRWGDAPSVLGPLGFKAGTHEVFPIPASEIGKSGLRQNSGY